MARLTDPSVARAITLLYESTKEAQRLAQVQLNLADDLHGVASALHDLLLETQQTALRVVG